MAALALLAALTTADQQTLVAALRAKQIEHDVPAMGLVLLDGGRPVLVQTFGAEPDTPFRLGSITKTFTALGLLTVTTIDPGQAVTDVLPKPPYQNPFQQQAPLKIGHLLELSAGLADLSRGEWNDNRPVPLETALERGRRHRTVLWPPGFQHAYSNVPPGFSAAVIEQATGQRYEDYLRRAVLRPLGMNRATFEPDPRLPGGFKADGQTPIPYWHMTYRAFGALNASTEEMSRFLSMLLQRGGGVFEPTHIDAMFGAGTTRGNAAGLEIGYGAGMYGRVRRGHVFHGHGGDADGYRSRFGLLPDAGRGYFIVINVDDPALLREMEALIEAALVANLPQPDAPPALEVDTTRYTGTYYPASARFGVERWRRGDADRLPVSVRADGLLVEGRRRTRLLAVGAGRFRRPDDPLTTVVIFEYRGRLFMQGELGNYVRLESECNEPGAGFAERCIWQ